MANGATAVILSGGGAHGAFEVGVMKALFSGQSAATKGRPLAPDIFTGASVGSFNAAAMAMQPGVDCASAARRLEEIWTTQVADTRQGRGNGVYRFRGDPLQFLDLASLHPSHPRLQPARDVTYLAEDWLRRAARFAFSSGALSDRALGFIDLSTFISVEPFSRLLAETLRLDRIRQPDAKLLRIIATNWITGEVKIFKNADMTDDVGCSVIMASSAIPGIFPSVSIGADSYVDGGVVMNTPLSAALDAGATELHVIYMDADVRKIPLASLPDTFQTFGRCYTILQTTKIEEDITTAEWINKGLEFVEEPGAGDDITSGQYKVFVRVAGKIAEQLRTGKEYRKLTIHRYNPEEALGSALSMLNFSNDAIHRLVELGFNSGRDHDCVRSRCLIPK